MRSEISGNRQSGDHDKCEDDGKTRTPKLIKDDLREQDRNEGEGGESDEVEGEIVILNRVAERDAVEPFPAESEEVDHDSEVEESVGSTIKGGCGHLVALLK